MPMQATRYQNTSTTANLTALAGLIQDRACEEVRLFASPSTVTPEFSKADGPETNLPLVVALAKYKIPGITDVYVLFDGLFLTASRSPRVGEVRRLLDLALASRKAYVSSVNAPFTSKLEAIDAVKLLLNLGPCVPLTTSSRKMYFAQLSKISEEMLAELLS